jgi:acetylornithine deacetylase/succinyl-diaminopimelate desuccinylase-like protein
MSSADISSYVNNVWDSSILPALQEYVSIPNVSKAYSPTWREDGNMMRAAEFMRAWCVEREIAGMNVDLLTHESLTPVILIDIPAFNMPASDDSVLLYGHLDKQPEMEGWRADLGPWKPVIEDGKLYGRGGADDGYAVFASLTAIEAAQKHGVAHHRCVVIIEASEESGSVDLEEWLDILGTRLGNPSLVICLDSGCLDYERMWVTTSLRGLTDGVLRVQISNEGHHSGDASGIVPSSFRIARQLLDRLEDSTTGELLIEETHAEIPAHREKEARDTAAEFPEPASSHFTFVDGAQPVTDDPAEQLLNRTWRPTLSITGVDGMPHVDRAGNVLRPFTSLRLSFRLPPSADAQAVLEAVRAELTRNVPYGAHASFENCTAASGWNAPTPEPWLTEALNSASLATFGNEARAFGEGGSIPFMGMLGERFPQAQFVITGVLGPMANAHGPNEFLHISTAKHLTACMTLVLAAHAER